MTGSPGPAPDPRLPIPGQPDAIGARADAVGVPAPTVRGGVLKPLLIFTGLRLGLIVVLAAVLYFVVPLIIALAIAIVLQLPLSMVFFARQREALNVALAARNSDRRLERARLRADLRGNDTIS